MKNSLILYSCLTLSCWSGPAVSPNYSFEYVANLEIERTRDHPSLPGSGEMVQLSLTHNFLKYGFDVIEPDIHNPVIHIGNGTQVLQLSCIITEFTDSDVIVVPYRHEDRGYTKTTLNHSSEADKENEKAELVYSVTESVISGYDYIYPLLGMISVTPSSGGAAYFSSMRCFTTFS